jgi:Flp pilus assembly protein TadG
MAMRVSRLRRLVAKHGLRPVLVTLSSFPATNSSRLGAFLRRSAFAAARIEGVPRSETEPPVETRPMRTLRKRSAQRRGTAVVETAVVLPVYVLLVLAIIEFGHATMVINLLQSGCRTAARMGSMQGPNTDQVIAKVRQTLGTAIDPGVVNVYVQDASSMDSGAVWPTTDAEVQALPPIELSEAEPRQMFVVRASVNYNDVSVLPMPFLAGVTLDAQAFMRHE